MKKIIALITLFTLESSLKTMDQSLLIDLFNKQKRTEETLKKNQNLEVIDRSKTISTEDNSESKRKSILEELPLENSTNTGERETLSMPEFEDSQSLKRFENQETIFLSAITSKDKDAIQKIIKELDSSTLYRIFIDSFNSKNKPALVELLPELNLNLSPTSLEMIKEQQNLIDVNQAIKDERYKKIRSLISAIEAKNNTLIQEIASRFNPLELNDFFEKKIDSPDNKKFFHTQDIQLDLMIHQAIVKSNFKIAIEIIKHKNFKEIPYEKLLQILKKSLKYQNRASIIIVGSLLNNDNNLLNKISASDISSHDKAKLINHKKNAADIIEEEKSIDLHNILIKAINIDDEKMIENILNNPTCLSLIAQENIQLSLLTQAIHKNALKVLKIFSEKLSFQTAANINNSTSSVETSSTKNIESSLINNNFTNLLDIIIDKKSNEITKIILSNSDLKKILKNEINNSFLESIKNNATKNASNEDKETILFIIKNCSFLLTSLTVEESLSIVTKSLDKNIENLIKAYTALKEKEEEKSNYFDDELIEAYETMLHGNPSDLRNLIFPIGTKGTDYVFAISPKEDSTSQAYNVINTSLIKVFKKDHIKPLLLYLVEKE